MIYGQPKETTGEILRLVIPSMAQHDAAYHPLTYTVWYESLAGLNPGLKEEIDAIVQRGEKLTDAAIEDVYNRHIRKRDDTLSRQIQENLQRLVNEVGQLTSEATGNVGSYRDSLLSCVDKLKQQGDSSTLQTVLQVVIAETVAMRQSMTALQEQLEDRDRQVAVLRDSVNAAQDQAMTDPLTGLLNRRGFSRALEHACTESEDINPLNTSMLMIDIDHFKAINDNHGHLMGDKVIRSVAHLLKANVKGRDTVARMGGEEFAVLLINTPLHGAANLAEQIRNTIATARFRRADSLTELGVVTVSLGVASYALKEDPEAFIHRADMALYQSKRTGRNRVTLAPTVK